MSNFVSIETLDGETRNIHKVIKVSYGTTKLPRFSPRVKELYHNHKDKEDFLNHVILEFMPND